MEDFFSLKEEAAYFDCTESRTAATMKLNWREEPAGEDPGRLSLRGRGSSIALCGKCAGCINDLYSLLTHQQSPPHSCEHD